MYPAPQVQAVEMLLPAGELEFVGHVKHVETLVAPTDVEYVLIPQSMHVADPASVLYFPAMHSEQVSPLGPEEPALHVQAVKVVLPARASEFDGHVKQVTCAVAATAVEYLPTTQSTQPSDPAEALYFPATQ